MNKLSEHNDKKRVLMGAIATFAQVVLTVGVFFFLYRFLLNTIGVQGLGIWSLILATTSVAQVASLGFSGSVVKYVARYFARSEHSRVSLVIQTASISIGVVAGGVLVAGYPLVKFILKFLVPSGAYQISVEILPMAILAMWIAMVAGIFQSGLDGVQRIYVRNYVVILGLISYAALCYFLSPRYGLLGVAYAQILSNFCVLIVSWGAIRKYLPILPILPYRWDNGVFREIFSYGVNFQIISITGILSAPITKAFLSKFGGLPAVGYYEMASRMVQQFRSLIVSVNQVLVPSFATLAEKSPERIQDLYLVSYRLLFYISLPVYVAIILISPILSNVLIGHYQGTFIFFSIILSIGWFLNTLNAPAYFANLGIGALKWNVAGHILGAILNTILGGGLGLIFGAKGVVVGGALSSIIGSAVIYLSYHLNNRIPLSELWPHDSRFMSLSYVLLLGVFLALLPQMSSVTKMSFLKYVFPLGFITFAGVMAYNHPLSGWMLSWIKRAISGS